MAKAPLSNLLQYLRAMYPAQDTGDQSDAELLNQFVTQRDDNAFTVLVQRHGTMVLSVCQRLLGDRHLAEDGFQATFIILARRASTIRSRTSLGTWLYAVAQRVATKARAKTSAQRNRERQARTMATEDRLDERTWQELRSIIDEEIARLPDKYQAPLVLCHLEGKSHNRAAKELGCAKTTLERRLCRGRELLRQLFVKRGITLSTGVLATVLGDKVAGAPLSALLTANTVKAAACVISGKTLVGVCLTARALALAEEAMVGMVAVKAKLIVLVMTFGLVVGGASWAGFGGGGEKSQAVLVGKEQPSSDKDKMQQTGKKLPVTADLYGDPLPEGAVARLGTKRFHHEGFGWCDRGLVYTPDGKNLVGFTYSGIVLWDAATGKERYRLPVSMRGDGPGSLAISPDGTTLATSNYAMRDSADPQIDLWELQTGKKAQTLFFPKDQQGPFDRICFTPNGKNLTASSRESNKVFVFDLASGEVRMSVGGQDPQFYDNHAIAPDGQTLAVAVYSPNNASHSPSIEIRDIVSGKLRRTIRDLPAEGIGDRVFVLNFAPDGRTLAFGGLHRIFLYDPATGKRLGTFEDKMGQLIGLGFTTDGKKLICGGAFPAKLFVWDVANGKLLNTIPLQTREGSTTFKVSMAIAPDGKTVALGAGSSVLLWDVATGKELFTQYQGHNDDIVSLAYAPDGKTLVSAGHGGPILFWDTANWKRRGVVPGVAHSFSPDGKLLAIEMTTADSLRVQIWDMAGDKEALVLKVPDADRITSAVFSADGRKLFTLDVKVNDRSQRIRHWDLASGKQDQIWKLPSGGFFFGPLAPDGFTAFRWMERQAMEIVNVRSGRNRLFDGPGSSSYHPKLSPDGRMLVSGAKDADMCLYEVMTGKEIHRLNGHQGRLGLHRGGVSFPLGAAIAWSADGRLLASGDERKNFMEEPTEAQTVRLWDTASGKEVACFKGIKTDVSALSFAPDGTSLATGLRDGTILIFDVRKAHPKLPPAPKLGKDELEFRWIDLIGENAGKAHQAIGILVASSTESVPFLQRRLKPIEVADQSRVQQLIGDLNSDKFAVRQTRAKELEKIGAQLIAPIQKALKGNIPLEVHRRLENILNTISDVPGPETIRTIRAIIALERIGTPEAQAVLETLAGGAPGARETEEAKASLERLKQRVAKVP